MSILVTGSTGIIGTQVLDHLKDSGAELRALTRSPGRAHFPAGVTPVQGELADVDGLRRAMQGVTTLFLLAPVAADEFTQSLQALSIAREAGVRGIVYLSVFKGDEYVDVPHFSCKRTAERMIEAFDMPATILRPAYFMQNDVRQKEPMQQRGIFGMPIGSKGISMVDVRDIGDAAARELLRRERSDVPLPSETYALVGPDAITSASVAAIWSEALGREVQYGGDDLDRFESNMKTMTPPWLAYDMRLMLQRYQQDGAVASAAEIERFSQLLERAPRNYREFARATASEWRGK